MEDSNDTWVIDSGATNHVCFSVQGFEETRSLASNEVSLRTGDGSLVLAEAIGNVRIYFDNYRFLLLKDVFFVPNFKRNLISVAYLVKDSYTVSFGQTAVIRKNNIFVCSGDESLSYINN